MNRLCVIGDPVERSLSPAMHNAALEYLGLGKEYFFGRLRVPRDGLEQFAWKFRKGEFSGACVTMPYKETIIPFLDMLADSAAQAGAVNTVTRMDDVLEGHNTDGAGCVRALQAAGVDANGSRFVILGAGGAARAAAFALATAGAGAIHILNRTAARARGVADSVRKVASGEVGAGSLGDMREALMAADALINATPVGMPGMPENVIVPGELLRQGMTVLDMVYDPLETPLLRYARKAGARAVPGTEMLLHQGAAQFKLFTGRDAPIDIMKKALEGEL
jgi:shikimate dehydrogenase